MSSKNDPGTNRPGSKLEGFMLKLLMSTGVVGLALLTEDGPDIYCGKPESDPLDGRRDRNDALEVGVTHPDEAKLVLMLVVRLSTSCSKLADALIMMLRFCMVCCMIVMLLVI